MFTIKFIDRTGMNASITAACWGDAIRYARKFNGTIFKGKVEMKIRCRRCGRPEDACKCQPILKPLKRDEQAAAFGLLDPWNI